MAVEHEVAALAFEVETGLDAAGIRAAGRRAAEAGRRYMQTTITESFAAASALRYLARGPGGSFRQMSMRLSWTETGDGRRRVRLTVEDYLVEQCRVLGVPLGRRTVPALPSARRFADVLREELTGRPAYLLRNRGIDAAGRDAAIAGQDVAVATGRE